MKRYAVIIPYYGRWPSFFSLFLKGVELNLQLKIILITDLPTPKLPVNVIRQEMSLRELKQRFETVLQTPVGLETSYKLCDLRPMYGLVFQEELNGMDYWGHCDIDLIFGNLNAVTQPLMRAEYDLISLKKYWLSGSFCLYRNSKEINTLFRFSKDWKQVCSSAKHFAFDEIGGNFYKEALNGTPLSEIKTSVESMSQIVFRLEKEEKLKFYHENHIHEPYLNTSLCHFISGELFSNRKPIVCHHFLFDKRRCCFHFPKWKSIPDEFYFDTYGFYTNKSITFRWILILCSIILSPWKLIQKAIPSIKENGIIGFLRKGFHIFLRTVTYS